MEVKKKRGRPRKSESGSKPALSPMPISASIPLTGDFSGWKSGGGKPFESIKKPLKLNDFDEGNFDENCRNKIVILLILTIFSL
jgi:hypothetical protein